MRSEKLEMKNYLRNLSLLISPFSSFLSPFSSLISHLSSPSGFTLIEILVVFSLITVVSGVGFASFSEYNKKQTLNQAALNLKQTLELAKFNALSSVKPISCGEDTSLGGYKVVLCAKATCATVGSYDYEIKMICGGSDVFMESKKFPQNITLNSLSTTCSEIKFRPLSGVLEGQPCNIVLSGFGSQKQITLDSIGSVAVQ